MCMYISYPTIRIPIAIKQQDAIIIAKSFNSTYKSYNLWEP